MIKPVLTYLTALTSKQITKQKLQKISLINGYQVEWNNSSDFNLLCEDEDVNQVISLHQDKITGVMKLQHQRSRGCFLTIGLDHTIQVFKFYGENVATLDGHEDIILGVLELKSGDVVTVSQDKTLRFWDPLTGTCKSMIEAGVNSLDSVQFFSNSKELAISEPDGVSIWDFSGKHIIKLKGQKNQLSFVYELESSKRLVWGKGEKPSVWSEAGDCLKRFNFSFSHDNGFVVNNNTQQLLIKNDNGLVSLWKCDGTIIDSHIECSEVSELFTQLSEAQYNVERHIELHPNINHYSHLRNFFGSEKSKSLLVPAKELSSQQLNFESDPKQKELWDFFNRPIPRLLTTAMKKEVKVARGAEKKLTTKIEFAKEAIDKHIEKRRTNKVISLTLLFLSLVILAAGAFFVLDANGTDIFNQLVKKYISSYRDLKQGSILAIFAVSASATLLFSFIFFMKNRTQKRKQLTQTGNLTLLNAMLPAFHNVIDKVKAHREMLWRSVPLKLNRNLYSGESTHNIMQDVVKNKIEKLGLEECGLEKEDVIYSNHEAIVLSDWSLIQSDEKRSIALNKLQHENEFSFWGDKNGSLIFAVQYIQFIFLTAEKIDLFTTFYDFINQKCIGKEANAFYYKDVTNISKREVDRPNGLGDDNISATEISLSVASSDKIRLTILNEDSLKSIVEAAKQHDEKEKVSDHSILMELESRKKKVEQDIDMDEEEREEELDDIETQIKSMNRDNATLDSVFSTNKADEAIRNIRTQIRHHKKDYNEETVSEL